MKYVQALIILLLLGVLGFEVHGYLPNRSGNATPPFSPIKASFASLEPSAELVQGAQNAPIQIVEFLDYQCPPCRALSPKLDAFVAKHPSQVALYDIDWPLVIHFRAMPLARAARAAQQLGQFSAYHKFILQQQTDPTAVTASQIAAAIHVPTKTLLKLARSSGTQAAVNKGINLATALKLPGTPTALLFMPSGRAIQVNSIPWLLQQDLSTGFNP